MLLREILQLPLNVETVTWGTYFEFCTVLYMGKDINFIKEFRLLLYFINLIDFVCLKKHKWKLFRVVNLMTAKYYVEHLEKHNLGHRMCFTISFSRVENSMVSFKQLCKIKFEELHFYKLILSRQLIFGCK